MFANQMRTSAGFAILSQLGRASQGVTTGSNPTNLFFGKLTETARDNLKRQLFPDIYFVFGSLIDNLEKIFLLLWAVYMITNIISFAGRLKFLLLNYQCSLRLCLGIFSNIFTAFLPFARAPQNQIDKIEANANDLKVLSDTVMHLQARLDALTLNMPNVVNSYTNMPISKPGYHHISEQQRQPK